MNEPVFKPDILLIDISGLAYAAMFSPQGSLEHEGFPTGAIHGAIKSVFARMAEHPEAVPIILWDSKAVWRHEMLPEYKSSRSATPEKAEIRKNYKMQIPHLQVLMSAMGMPQVSCGGAEADDVAGVLCRNLDQSWNIELVSRDGDWLQALDERTVWYSPVHRKGLSLKGLSDPDNGLKDGYFLSTDELLQAKALAGDASDEIPGVYGVGITTALKVIRQHGTKIEDFWSKVDSGDVKPKGVIQTKLASNESRDIFKRNMTLMDWRLAPPLDLSLLAVTAGKPDFELLDQEARQLGMKNLIFHAKRALSDWRLGYGEAVYAVDRALHHRVCHPLKRPG